MSDQDRGDVQIAMELCKGCALCIDACPPGVLRQSEVVNRRAYYPVFYVGDGCTGCGICFYVCPEPAAITVSVSERGHAPAKGQDNL